MAPRPLPHSGCWLLVAAAVGVYFGPGWLHMAVALFFVAIAVIVVVLAISHLVYSAFSNS